MLRFAPSLTENMNVDNLRVALFNFIMAKKLGEDLLIRVEDIDKKKNIENKDKEILEILNLFSIDYKSVVYQSENLKYHQKLAMQLMGQKKAFTCFCGDKKLDELKKQAQKEGKNVFYDGFCETLSDETILNTNAPFTVRIKKPTENIVFNDLLKGDFDYSFDEIDSFVILNHEKTPTYDYACAVDDMLYNISLVITNEKYLSNAPKQIHIRKQLNYDKQMQYIHIPSIINKKDNKTSVNWLINEGFLPVSIANYLVLLNNKTPKEIFTLEEAIEWFDIKNIAQNDEKFNIDKLKEINKIHLEKLDDLRLSKLLGFADEDIGKLAKLYLDEVSTLRQMKTKITAIFSKKKSLKGFEEEFIQLKECLKKAPFIDNLDELKAYLIKNTKLENQTLDKLLRYILTKEEKGPDLKDIYSFIKNYLGEIIK